MKRVLLSFLAASLISLQAHAGTMMLMGAGTGAPSAPAAGYTGPGDIVASATAWYGLRAYNAAKASAGVAAINVCNVADVACADMVVNSSGDLVITTIGGSSCSVVTCTVKKLYDQTAGSNCTGSCDVIDISAIAVRPTLIVSCTGGKPCLSFSGVDQGLCSSGNLSSVSQPFTISTVSERSGNFTTIGVETLFGSNGETYWQTTTNTKGMYAGTGQTVTASDSAFHAYQNVLNGASGDLNLDGSVNTLNAGALATGSSLIRIGVNNCGGTGHQPGTMYLTEVGLWPSAFTSGNSTSMSSNQHTYWGF